MDNSGSTSVFSSPRSRQNKAQRPDPVAKVLAGTLIVAGAVGVIAGVSTIPSAIGQQATSVSVTAEVLQSQVDGSKVSVLVEAENESKVWVTAGSVGESVPDTVTVYRQADGKWTAVKPDNGRLFTKSALLLFNAAGLTLGAVSLVRLNRLTKNRNFGFSHTGGYQ